MSWLVCCDLEAELGMVNGVKGDQLGWDFDLGFVEAVEA
jgi:hypothetical protein